MNLIDSAPPLERLDRLVADAEELIQLLRMGLINVQGFSTGSDRYKRVLNAYEQLTYAKDQLRGLKAIKWERTLVRGKDGDFLISCLHDLKDHLESAGEGDLRPPLRTELG